MKPEKFDPKEENDKSETPRTVGKKNRDKREAKITQKRGFETHQKRFRDSRSGQNFPRSTFFKVPFFTPTCRSHFDCSLSSLKKTRVLQKNAAYTGLLGRLINSSLAFSLLVTVPSSKFYDNFITIIALLGLSKYFQWPTHLRKCPQRLKTVH